MKEWMRKVWRFVTGPGRAKDTEARHLNEQLCQRVDDLKEKASKGDSDATLKLGALKQGLTEQSLRLLPKKSKALGVLMIAVLALAVGGGCSGGLGAKTAKDIQVALEDPILPEYLQYVDADPKLKPQDKEQRRLKVQALRFVVEAARK